jgi:hypothetical protein
MPDQDRIMIIGPNEDGTYTIEFQTPARNALRVSIPQSEAAAIRRFQERIPNGLFLSETPQTHQSIGEYYCAFSELEHELGEAIKVVLRLEGHVAADAIVAAVQDFHRKANIVLQAVQGAKNADGTNPTPEWKSAADQTLREVIGCNNPHRVRLAHDHLKPHTDGSLDLQQPGKEPNNWSSEEFERKIAKVKALTSALRTLRTELTTLNIPVPTGWMSIDAFQQPMPRPASRAPSDNFGSWVPRPPPNKEG